MGILAGRLFTRLWRSALVAVMLLVGWSVAWAGEPVEYRLYFPRTDLPALGVEVRRIESGAALSERVRGVLDVLVLGPKGDFSPAFPPGRSLRQVFIDRSGTAVVDVALDPQNKGPLGATEEQLRLWAVVNTLCDNFNEIKAVKILVGGDEVPDFGGHLDISRPLLPNMELVQEDGR